MGLPDLEDIKILNDGYKIIFKEIFEIDLEEKFNISKSSKLRLLLYKILDKVRKGCKNRYTNRKLIYVDENYFLLGNQYFGFIDRGTNVIEVRPITGCINKCIFCSVFEGPGTDFWKVDFYVDVEYMIEYSKWISRFKGKKNLEFLINPQGEAILYKDLPELVQGLKENSERVGLVTSLWPLNEKLILESIDSGLDFISLSLHSLDPLKSKILMGNPEYDVEKVIDFIKYINDKVDITLTPVIIKRYNIKDLEEIIKFAKKNIKNRFRPVIVPQKYLLHKHGRKIKDEKFEWKEFFEYLKNLEQKYSIKLTFSNKDFKMERRKEIPTPFKKGEIVKVEIVSEGRRYKEFLVNARERTFSVYSNSDKFKKAKIVRAKNNIIIAIA